MLPERISEDIQFELGEIDALIQLYREELLEVKRPPGQVELIALAGVLHSFYNGIEKTLLIIAKNNIPDVTIAEIMLVKAVMHLTVLSSILPPRI